MKKRSSVKFWLVASILAVVIVLIGIWSYGQSSRNYAEEAAKPLEESLIKSGASKISASGDPGHGPDNIRPWYDASFSVNLSRPKAVDLIEKIAKNNGYTLHHATPQDRGHLGGVADKYIDNWYFDDMSKKADYQGLQEGNVELAMAVNYEQVAGEPDMTPTTIRLQVGLPRFK